MIDKSNNTSTQAATAAAAEAAITTTVMAIACVAATTVFFVCLFSNRNGCVESYLGATDATFYTLQSTTFQMTGRCGKSV